MNILIIFHYTSLSFIGNNLILFNNNLYLKKYNINSQNITNDTTNLYCSLLIQMSAYELVFVL